MVLAAVLNAEAGQREEVDVLLERDLGLAPPGNYQQPFLQFGPPARDLLDQHRTCSDHGASSTKC